MVGTAEVENHREGPEGMTDEQAQGKNGIVGNGRENERKEHDSRNAQDEGRDDASLEGKRDESMGGRDNNDKRQLAAGKKVKNAQPQQGERYQHPGAPTRQPSFGNNISMPWGGQYGHSYGHPNNGYGHPPPPPPPPHYHHAHHQSQMPPMPPYGGNHYSGHPMGSHRSMHYPTHYGNHYSNHAPGPYPSHGMPQPYPTMQSSDSASISSKGSKGSKKRTIEGVHDNNGMIPMGSSGYAIRRTDSSSSATSTVTAGNNTSNDSHLIHDSPHSKRDRSQDLPPLNMGGIGLHDEHDRHRRSRNHRRELSADASTTSSLSVGLSLASYEGQRGAMDENMMSDHSYSKQKRQKGIAGAPLIVETGLQIRPSESEEQEPSVLDHMPIEAKAQISTRSDESNGSRHQNLFLSLSTSPINGADVDATPISKNTKTYLTDKSKSSIFKSKGGSGLPKLEISTSDVTRPVETPTPPVHGELGDIMTDDHNTLNHHLRGQSFTPLHGLSNGDGELLAPQLSWSNSVGELGDWEDEKKSEGKIRPASSTSQGSRKIVLSPHDFQLWKEDHEGEHGATTPLPAFFENNGNHGSENHMNYDSHQNKSQAHHHHGHMRSSNHAYHHHHHNYHGHPMGKPMPPPVWSKAPEHHTSMPPTPMYGGSDYRDGSYRDNAYMARSPYGEDRRDAGAFQFYPHPTAPHSTDRVRNLRGRMHPGAHHYPPMLHIPPPMTTHLPMTSPMALPGKAGLWSPHGNMGSMASPHHMTSPLNSMTQSKRKCVPLKPPIPSKFQGDIEGVKNVPVPEFTSLVNFPVHMSQKQSVNLPEGMRCCVMCGQACPCSNGNKNKKNKKSGEAGTRSADDLMREKSNGYAIIPTQNKGLCTLCDVNVWVVCQSGLEIKWCKGCKNFRPWAAFGDKGLATKCLRCRERQREKYALQKEEKEKSRAKDTDMTKKMGIKTM